MILQKAKSAYIFKTIVDPFIGKYSLIKVCSGVLKTDDLLYDKDKDSEAKIGKLYVLQGNKPIEVKGAACRGYRCAGKAGRCPYRRQPFYKGNTDPVCKGRAFCPVYVYAL